MFKSKFDPVALTGFDLIARDWSPEEAFKMTPVPHNNKTANIIAWYAVNIFKTRLLKSNRLEVAVL